MKWLAGLLLLGIVIFLTLGIIANKKFDTERKARQAEETQKTTATTDRVPELNAGESAPATGPASVNAPVATPESSADSPVRSQPEDEPSGLGRPEAASIIGSGKAGPILEAARLFGVTPMGVKTDAGGAIIKVTWTGNDEKAGQKFLDELKTQKLINGYNMDESKEDYRFDKGEKAWTASYRIAY